mgnify:CR=1 FL=1
MLIGGLLALLYGFSALKMPRELHCVTIESTDRRAQITAFGRRGIPECALAVDESIELNVGKHGTSCEFDEGNKYHTLRYDLTNTYISAQLEQHGVLLTQLRREHFFRFQPYCFLSGQHAFLVFKQRATDVSLEIRSCQRSLPQLQKVYLLLLLIVRKLEKFGAVFTQPLNSIAIYGLNEHVWLSPKSLAFIYAVGQSAYVSALDPLALAVAESQKIPIVSNRNGLHYVLTEATAKGNARFFITLLANDAFNTPRPDLHQEEQRLFASFQEKLYALYDRELVSSPVQPGWREMKEFVLAFGMYGSFADEARRTLELLRQSQGQQAQLTPEQMAQLEQQQLQQLQKELGLGPLMNSGGSEQRPFSPAMAAQDHPSMERGSPGDEIRAQYGVVSRSRQSSESSESSRTHRTQSTPIRSASHRPASRQSSPTRSGQGSVAGLPAGLPRASRGSPKRSVNPIKFNQIQFK